MTGKDDKDKALLHKLVKAKHNEDKRLKEHIDQLDRQCRVSLVNINNGMLAEMDMMAKIRRVPPHKRSMYSSNGDLIDTGIERSFDFSNSELKAADEEDPDITVSGQRIGRPMRSEPKMTFWSQDISTRLPVMSSFYGFRIGLQRSMTEVKLLGESMYGEHTRDIQSADPTFTRKSNHPHQLTNFSKIKPNGGPKFTDSVYQEENKQGPPPPSRESRANLGSAMVKKFPKLQKPAPAPVTRASDPSEISLNMKQSENTDTHRPITNKQRRDQLKMVLSRSNSSPDGRVLRENVKLLSFKTREEATKHYRKLLENKKDASAKSEVPAVHVVGELERSYSFVPTVKEEVSRPQTDVKVDRAQTGSQYTKSEYGINMQNSISRKVLNRQTLPMPFRKNHNTFLKHYGYPNIDEKTRHYNTPETPFTCTPVSLIN